jgi:protein-L-isoaspartate(D-aspartate) O-methyltransferase
MATAQLFALALSLVIETPIAVAVCATDRRSALATMGAALVATGATHSFAWWASTTSTSLSWGAATFVIELGVIAVEIFAYRFLARASWRRAALASLIANVASFGVGQAAWQLGAPPVVDTQQRLVAAARASGVTDARVLDAVRSVPRAEFVPPSQRVHASEDRSLPIEHGQRITQPSLVAMMTELLALSPGAKVLEVGTGSGYHAAILAHLTDDVFTIEIVPELAEQAAARLRRLGFSSVRAKVGDGYLGWPEHAPFDAIVVTCAPEHVPEALARQLKEGGRMVIPIGPDDGPQTLVVLRKQDGTLVSVNSAPVQFVPLVR